MFWVFVIRININRWVFLKIPVVMQPCCIQKILNSNKILSHL